MRAIAVTEISQVGEARRVAVDLALQAGFNDEDRGRVAIIATELATNLIKHAGGGEILVGRFDDRTGQGVECIALDKGPGIADVDAALRDGHSTAGTAGTGLGAVVRGSHVVDIYSRPQAGTVVLARMQAGHPRHAAPAPPALSGRIKLPKHGETVSGDDWGVHSWRGGVSFVVADGLGHGPDAAKASNAAVATFLQAPDDPVADIVERMHGALRSTRGAAVAVGNLDLDRGRVAHAGVGNIASALVWNGSSRRMISHNGTVGLAVKRIQTFDYEFTELPLVILASDGLGTGWSLDAYPGLSERHPAVIAAVLYRDFTLGRDDVTVLVVRASQL